MILSFSTFGQNCCPASTEPCAFASLRWVSIALACRINYCHGNLCACLGSMCEGSYKLHWPAHWGSTKNYVSILTCSQIKGCPRSGCFGYSGCTGWKQTASVYLQRFVHLIYQSLKAALFFSSTYFLPSIPPHTPSNHISVFIRKYPQMSKYSQIITRTALTLLTSQFSVLTCVASW